MLKLLMLSALALMGCSTNAQINTTTTNEVIEVQYNEATAAKIQFKDNAVNVEGKGVSVNGTTVTIQQVGEYVVSGKVTDGQIIVDTQQKGTVTIVLDNATIQATSVPAILVANGDETIVYVKENTTSTLSSKVGEVDENAVIFAHDNLTIAGKGTLVVQAESQDGIKANDDLTISEVTLNITAGDDGIAVNDTALLQEATIQVDAKDDGINAGKSDGSTVGAVTIEGGSLEITAGDDGIDATGDITVLEEPVITIQTANGAPELSAPSNMMQGGKQFGQMPQGEMPQGQMPQGQMPIQNENGQWKERRQDSFGRRKDGQMQPGTRPDGMMPDMTTEATPDANMQPIQDNTTTSNETTTTTSSTTNSAKGLNTTGNILIKNGTITINSEDDAMNADQNITIEDGKLTIQSGDDAIHAEATLTINKGTIQIERCSEGLEGNQIVVNDGEVTIVASDDGVNTSSPDSSDPMYDDGSYLTVNGGMITVNAGGDGVDLNGSGEMNGGTLIVYGPTNTGNSAIDYNGTFNINGGTFLAGGPQGMAEVPSNTSKNAIIALGVTQGVKTVELKEGNTVIASYTSEKTYNHLIISDTKLEKGKTYTIYYDNQEQGTITLSDTISYFNTQAGGMKFKGF